MNGEVTISDGLSYKIYDRKDLGKAYEEMKAENKTHIYPVGTKDAKVINGFLKHIKGIPINFKTHLIIFFLDYTKLNSEHTEIIEHEDESGMFVNNLD